VRLAALLLAAAAATVQSPESVTVTGTRGRQVLEKFIEGFTIPSRITGKMARWQDGICPVTIGLAPRFAAFITRRVRDVAAQAGAPVNAGTGCKPNIEIVFTATPQALIDRTRKDHPGFLGYYDNDAQLEKLATVSRPIQAWYTTATQDLHGKVEIDSGKTIGPGLEVWLPCPRTPGVCLVNLPNARAEAVTGSRLGDGLRSALYHVIIVADPNKLLAFEIGPLADYIALLALSQINIPESCQPLSSIVNLLGSCGQKSGALTENDLGYLKGLYHMGPERTLRTQQDEIAYQMEQTLSGK
jgi:hypothetical protein